MFAKAFSGGDSSCSLKVTRATHPGDVSFSCGCTPLPSASRYVTCTGVCSDGGIRVTAARRFGSVARSICGGRALGFACARSAAGTTCVKVFFRSNAGASVNGVQRIRKKCSADPCGRSHMINDILGVSGMALGCSCRWTGPVPVVYPVLFLILHLRRQKKANAREETK